MLPMTGLALFGVRGFLRGLGMVLPRGFVWFVLLGGAAIVAAMVIIWAVGRRKQMPF